jgi:hypothetical protein
LIGKAKLNLTPGRKRAERNQLSERERERERKREGVLKQELKCEGISKHPQETKMHHVGLISDPLI